MTIQDTDFLLIHRNGVDYKITAKDLQDYINPNTDRPWDSHDGGIWHVVIPDGYDSKYPEVARNGDFTIWNMDGTEHVYDPADRLIGPTEVMILSNPTGWKFGSMGPMELGELTDTSKMTSLSELFAYGNCIGDTTDFNAWDMSNVTSIFSMFDSNMPMEQFICPDWDLRKCTNLTASIPKVKTAGKTDLSNWKLNTTEDVTMMSMFYFYKQLTGLDLSKWDTSRVTAMNMLFYKSDFDGDISSWCVQNISSEPPGFADNTPLAEAPEKNPKWGQAC